MHAVSTFLCQRHVLGTTTLVLQLLQPAAINRSAVVASFSRDLPRLLPCSSSVALMLSQSAKVVTWTPREASKRFKAAVGEVSFCTDFSCDVSSPIVVATCKAFCKLVPEVDTIPWSDMELYSGAQQRYLHFCMPFYCKHLH